MADTKPPAAGVPTRRSLPISLLRTREAVMQHFRPHLADLGLTEQQWRVLRVLGETGASEAGLVASRACILPPSLSRIVKSLQGEGVLQVHGDKADGRRSILSLTPAGEKMLARALPKSAAIYAALEFKIGRARLEQLLDLLETVQQAVNSEK